MTNQNSAILLTPFNMRGHQLRNRIAMAPLTRNRAVHGTDAPQALNAEYYSQRASAGLIISEATQISPTGKGYAWTPGIYSPEQIAGWKQVTERKEFNGPWMVNNGYTLEMAIEAVSSGYADLVAFGKLFLANPDLVERFKHQGPLNEPDSATFYGGAAKGYTDYPRLNEGT